VPANLVGMTQANAVAALEKAGLTEGQIILSPAPQAAGTVLSGSPASGTTVNGGTAVSLTLASGNQEVPSVRGLDVDTATAQLKAAGFLVGPTQTQASSTVADGDVISQDPSGSQPLGTTITLTVSSGSPTPTSSSTPPTSETSSTPPASGATTTPATTTTTAAP
jgi:beta-lactam-binding protein with PASTA domain